LKEKIKKGEENRIREPYNEPPSYIILSLHLLYCASKGNHGMKEVVFKTRDRNIIMFNDQRII